ncbi:MAG: HD domain-containing phosphohydrolase [Burkholderiaceae bacterium]
MTDTLLEAGASATDNPNYLRAVTDMSERCAVVTQDAIYSANGIKLVEKGARIDSRLYDRLVRHKLRDPIDQHLSVENVVNVDALLETARVMCQQQPILRLVQALGSAERVLAPLRYLPLTGPVAFKLTVMREQRPELFRHSLQMMLVALFLGIKNGMSERDCVPLAAAALLHDVGALYMAPAWRDPQNKVTGIERKHLVAHPITAMLMVRDAQVYSRAVEDAVLEHHERMDGTGYPRGLSGAQISPLGRTLILAEMVSAFYEKAIDMPAQQLSLALRLNHRKFPADLVAHVLPLLQEELDPDRSQALPTGEHINAMARALVQAFQQWEGAKAEQGAVPGKDGPAAFVEGRLQSLQKALTEAGAHPNHQEQLIEQLQGDADGLAEVAFVVREALWQLESIVNSCQRRWPGVLDGAQPSDQAVARWCDWVRAQASGAIAA